ncbi:hypothetical protein M878_00280 [Streptomyces roseochromogenus subsp. oscitans DS 12.976]|uniref:UspA domain-containing protein n=1 Tax=Streptomyces roseochromogenus subsp. oscitans DS 12.976 TaxID=1352936 RepID=V6KXC5_STRRC|nr:hypothetical protein M878_00280 [Streptomyces roseochromogenus subsp. oscitans DS 12.976]
MDATREVTVGEPLAVPEIESRTASLVVAGSRGPGAFGSLLLGSPPCILPHTAVARCWWYVAGRTRAVPYCCRADGSPAVEPAVDLAFAEASLRGADLVALHVWNTWSGQPHEGPDDPLNVVVDVERLRAEAQRLLDETSSPWQQRCPRGAVERRPVRSRVRSALPRPAATRS